MGQNYYRDQRQSTKYPRYNLCKYYEYFVCINFLILTRISCNLVIYFSRFCLFSLRSGLPGLAFETGSPKLQSLVSNVVKYPMLLLIVSS